MKKAEKAQSRKQAEQQSRERSIAYNVIDRIAAILKNDTDGAQKLLEIEKLKKQLETLENTDKIKAVKFDPAGFKTRAKTPQGIKKAFEKYKSDFYYKALELENIENRVYFLIDTAHKHPAADKLRANADILLYYFYRIQGNVFDVYKNIQLPQSFQAQSAEPAPKE